MDPSRGRLEHPLAEPVRLVPGPSDLAGLHERSMPQKDQLCGAFWGSLVLTAAGYPADQDEVALRAGTTLAEGDPAEWLPPGASPRTDYTLSIPVAADKASSGTSAPSLPRACSSTTCSGCRRRRPPRTGTAGTSSRWSRL